MIKLLYGYSRFVKEEFAKAITVSATPNIYTHWDLYSQKYRIFTRDDSHILDYYDYDVIPSLGSDPVIILNPEDGPVLGNFKTIKVFDSTEPINYVDDLEEVDFLAIPHINDKIAKDEFWEACLKYPYYRYYEKCPLVSPSRKDPWTIV